MLPFRHRHHRVLLDPLFQMIGIETECPTELHKRDSTLTDHRVQGMRGEAGVGGHFLNGQKRLVHLFFSVDRADISEGMGGPRLLFALTVTDVVTILSLAFRRNHSPILVNLGIPAL